MSTIVIIGFIFIIFGTVIIELTTDSNLRTLFGLFIFSIGVVFVTSGMYEKQPSAIDVYQGKTTLEITYKDGIPVDTVVVFKDKNYE